MGITITHIQTIVSNFNGPLYEAFLNENIVKMHRGTVISDAI